MRAVFEWLACAAVNILQRGTIRKSWILYIGDYVRIHSKNFVTGDDLSPVVFEHTTETS